MSLIIRRLLDSFCPNKYGYSVTLLGLEYSGKTTLLYLLKLGEVIKTIPSFGFNVETVKVPAVRKNALTMTGWDIGGGCGSRYPPSMLGLYVGRSDAIVWVVDSVDRERISESVESLDKVFAHCRLDDSGREKNVPILLLANKQDLPGAMSLDEIRRHFAIMSSKYTLGIFRSSLTQDIQAGGLPQAFDWLQEALENPTKAGSNQPVQPIPDPRSPHALFDKLESWLGRAENDSPPEEFIGQFQSINLPAWDHYTHIRIAYVILTMYGRQKGKNIIFDGIEHYIAQSAQTRGRTFHVTMTYFWIQLVHFGIRSMPPTSSFSVSGSASTLVDPQPAKDLDATLVDPKVPTDTTSPSPTDFARFLLLNPSFVDGNLWADYYTKDAMMSLEAKAGMVLPDKKPLPNLVVRDAIPAAAKVR